MVMITAAFRPFVRKFYTKQLMSIPSLSMSTSTMDKAEIVNISPVLRLHKFNNDASAPLTLLLPWATATERNLDRFRTLYADRGFNVLTAYSKLINFIRPRSAQPVAAEIIDYLCTQTGKVPIVVHAFSIGAFMYANILIRMADQHQQFSALQPRIRGQVFDSLIIGTLKEMRVGLAHMLSNNRTLQWLISSSSAIYFYLTHSNTVEVYDQLVDIFWKNPFHTPILCYYSMTDPMCKVESMERFLKAWKERTGEVSHSHCVPNARHAEILRGGPEDYRVILFKYLDTLRLSDQSSPLHSKL
ncbi:uncharacterized protein LOC110987444 [Acanthaster planci]|uniref:Uncharacterized protein LOC110987444 n=1 Tax=Acanthaster planci TaxID=133434 RepID=A0A8B7ZLV0_ACAPL|nr:uncharacterized protein LOC110987444 [Acanthaster planci]